ncbi:MAG: prolyl-tRNA synthetase associated domain-containing protein [Oscillospiraceae bacterium]|nr:prolyl-tRNA synthetase associated domain-containing protein [Oscillospiraceae bacterium]
MFVSGPQEGRPASPEGRAPAEQACYDLLDRLAIPYIRVDHDEAATIDLCGAVERVLGVPICKNLFLCNRQKTAFYLLLMDGDKPFKTKYLSAQLGCSRLSFASPEDMERLLGVAPGSATALALANDHENAVRLVVDRSVAEREFLGCHPCKNTASLRIRTKDILERFLPAVGHEPIGVNLPEKETE